MSSPDWPQSDEQLVVQYLLGSIPEEEATRLDELAFVSDEFAERLRAVEYDLVDAYVKGELSGEVLDRFQLHYLTSPARREKVKFAESLLAWSNRTPEVSARSARSPRRRWFIPALAFAATTCLVLACGYLLYENSRLRIQMTQTQRDHESLKLRERTLERQIGEQRLATATVPENKPAPPLQSTVNAIALILLPQTRGAGPIPAIVLSPTADRAEFRLELESGDFTGFQAKLKDLATNRVLWRGGNLKEESQGDSRRVRVSVPAGLLKPQNYSLELTAIPSAGARELLSSYAFRVVR
jgi:hypothetical protein